MDDKIDPNEFIQWLVFFVSDKEKFEKYGKRIIEEINKCVAECMNEAA